MKRNIRKGVFETNSSSTHSIVISQETPHIYDTIHPDGNGAIQLTGGEFGWSWERFDDAFTKACYCAVDQENNGVNINMLKEVLMEHTGAKEVTLEFSTDYNHAHWSYVDHQSYGTSSEAFGSKEMLKDFIFNPLSVLFTGNDNSEAPSNFFVNDRDIPYIPYLLKVPQFGALIHEPIYVRNANSFDEIRDVLESAINNLFDGNKYLSYDSNAVDIEKKTFTVCSWGNNGGSTDETFSFELVPNPEYVNTKDIPKDNLGQHVEVPFDQFLRSVNVDEETIGKIQFEMKKRGI